MLQSSMNSKLYSNAFILLCDSELEESLLVMPFHFATDLLQLLDVLLKQQRNVELVTKCLLFLMR